MDTSAALKEAYCGQDYESDFEPDLPAEDERSKRNDLAKKEPAKHVSKPRKQVFSEECSREQGRIRRFHELPQDAYTRHKKLINEYVLCYRGSTTKLRRNTSKDKTDHDVIKENHKFLWDEDEATDTWEKRLAKKYYDKLFKEYCITDLTHFKENKIAMRWRTEQEVIDGKGQFFCGSINCDEEEELRSWEVNFGYLEHGEKKNALVKLRLCPECSDKLNFTRKRKEVVPKGRKASYPSEKEVVQKGKRASSDEEQPMKIQKTSTESSHSKGEDDTGNNSDSAAEPNIWKQPIKDDDVSKDDEFEDYLADMLF